MARGTLEDRKRNDDGAAGVMSEMVSVFPEPEGRFPQEDAPAWLRIAVEWVEWEVWVVGSEVLGAVGMA